MLKGDELPANHEIVVDGGFEEAEKAISNHNGITELCANHEEANIRIILHTMHAFEYGYTLIKASMRCYSHSHNPLPSKGVLTLKLLTLNNCSL